MAKRSGGSNGGGSSIVLILFLVFFILLSIGLGVTTYLGFSAEDDKAAVIKKTKGEFSAMEKERDWYRFQADLYRAYMGHGQTLDYEYLGNARLNFDQNRLVDPNKKDDVKTLVATVLDPKMGWDPAQKRPKKNYEQLLAEALGKAKAAEDATAQAQAQETKAQLELKAKQDELKAALDAHAKEFKAYKDTALAELAKQDSRVKAMMKESDTNNATLAAQVAAASDDKIRIAKNLKEKDDLIADLRKELKRKDGQIATLRQDTGAEIVTDLKKDWKIVRIDSRGETAHINLGSADSVQTGLTFRIHGVERDGRASPKDKATALVLNVVGDHLSQIKITYDKTALGADGKPRHDPRTNPVLTGDVLINPSWYPNQKKHIAIAGIVDVTGDGRDDTEQFVRELERHNIVVDAYLDLRKDFAIKGPGITVQTDFLILGEAPEEVVGAPQGRAKEIKEKIDNGMETMRKQAKDSGVKVKNLRDYLDEIGYRIPGNPERKKPTIEVSRDAGAMPPPAPKNPPAQP